MPRGGLRRLAVVLAFALLCGAAAASLDLLPLATAASVNAVADLRLHGEALGVRSAFSGDAFDTPDPRLALIAIDDESIGNTAAGLGTFPFPRRVYATLLRRLHAAGARVVAMDIDFLEPAADPADDAAFTAAGRLVPTIAGFTVTTTAGGIAGAEPLAPTLRRALLGGYTTVDSPGGLIVGQPPMIGASRGAPQSLAVRSVRAFGTKLPARLPTAGGELLLLPFPVIGTIDETQRAGAQRSSAPFFAETLSFADALTEPPQALAAFAHGRIVLVGATAQALSDYAATFMGLIPGVFVHGRLIDQLLRGWYITPAPAWLNVMLAILLPLLLALALERLRPLAAIATAAGAIGVYAVVNLALFDLRLYWFDLVHVAGAAVACSLGVIAIRAVGEAAQRRAVTDLFGRHVSPAVVNEILRTGDADETLALSGRRAKVTIFYSDIRGFTQMSERMDPEAIYTQLNEYFEAMCAVIFAHGGYVDKFIGDCIMAVFSAPAQREDDAYHAVRAALEQQAVVARLAARWERDARPIFTVGMGLNTGEVVVGNLGSRTRMNYTVIGDEVNTAARLYNVAEGGQIVISESTYREVASRFDCRPLPPVSVKGKRAPLEVYEVTGVRELAVV